MKGSYPKIFAMVLILAMLISFLPVVGVSAAPTTVFINEIHYDNIGTDSGEAIEIAGPAGIDITGWKSCTLQWKRWRYIYSDHDI